MKKVCVWSVVCLFLALNSFAQSFYWIGPANGNWNNGSNWSFTQGGTAAGDFPQDALDNVILNTNASIALNTSIELNSLSVTGSGTIAKITGIGATDRTIIVKSTNAVAPALFIESGCTLESSAETNTWYTLKFDDNAKGVINGNWLFSGDLNINAIASFNLGDPGFTTLVEVNDGGSITIAPDGFIEPNELTGGDYLVFNGGASLELQGNAPIVPEANYNAASIIEITGVTDAGVTFEETGSVGTINYNCASQSNGSNPLYLSLLTFTVEGDLNIYNTNNQELSLLSYNSTAGLPSRDATIKGNLNIQGTSKVAIAHNDGPELPNNLYVEGNLVMNGTSLSLQTSTFISSQPTTLYVKGNITHNVGTLGALSNVVNESSHLFVIELNGASAQTINSHASTFDNAANQVTLRINNSSGVTLQSSLSVGRLSFNSANKGVLHTGTNILTINNTTPSSVSGIVLEMPATPSQGFVDGILGRRTASSEPALLPVGSGTNYRGLTLVPSAATATTYQAQFVNSAYGGTHIAPVSGTADYHWLVDRVGAGSDAIVQLNIPGQIDGALIGHDLSVAKHNGSGWVSAKGTTGTVVSPGTSTSGTVSSELQSSFGTYTIAFESEAALPTYLLSFDAKKRDKQVAELSWTITDNSTPSLFEIMRSAEGLNFQKIGALTGEESRRAYSFADRNMLTGNNYYRLRMIDKDGTITLTTVLMLSVKPQGVVLHSLMPTVVNNRAQVRITSALKIPMQLVVTDISGRVVHTRQVHLEEGTQDIWLDASGLLSGMFQITGYLAREKTNTLRFIKQ